LATIPSTNARTFWSVNTTIIISGATYASVANLRVKYGYKIHEEAVTGTNVPYVGTGVFHGEIDAELLGSSDSQVWNAISITSGIVTTLGMTWQEQDTQATMSARKWTASGKFMEYEKIWDRDKVVMYRLRGILVQEPIVS
jgi:hypothetical protein